MYGFAGATDILRSHTAGETSYGVQLNVLIFSIIPRFSESIVRICQPRTGDRQHNPDPEARGTLEPSIVVAKEWHGQESLVFLRLASCLNYGWAVPKKLTANDVPGRKNIVRIAISNCVSPILWHVQKVDRLPSSLTSCLSSYFPTAYAF